MIPANKEYLTAQDYQFAVDAQTASNASGLIHALHRIVDKIWNEADRDGKGTDWVNSHPIVICFVNQLAWLSARSVVEFTPFHEALKVCKERAEELKYIGKEYEDT